jgi:hypothetical protein
MHEETNLVSGFNPLGAVDCASLSELIIVALCLLLWRDHVQTIKSCIARNPAPRDDSYLHCSASTSSI